MTADRCEVCRGHLTSRQHAYYDRHPDETPYCGPAHAKQVERWGLEEAQRRIAAVWDDPSGSRGAYESAKGKKARLRCLQCAGSLVGYDLRAETCSDACRTARSRGTPSVYAELAGVLVRIASVTETSDFVGPATLAGDPEAEAAFFDRLSPVPDSGHGLGECWEHNGSPSGRGYAQARYRGERILAHRLAYLLFVGEVPDGYVVDHLCRNRRCANPLHLEAVTVLENLLRGDSPAAINARKTECASGHRFDDANTYVDPRGRRQCRTCRREAMRDYYERHPEQRGKNAAYAREWRRRKRAEREAVAA